MNKPDTHELAAMIARQLFTDGCSGELADRLVLKRERAWGKYEMCGWSLPAMTQFIEKLLTTQACLIR